METPQTVLYYDLVLEVWGASMNPGCGAQTRTVDCIVLDELSRFLVLSHFIFLPDDIQSLLYRHYILFLF